MRELALFAGGGGGILGGHLLGWTTICAVEIEDYARRVLLARQRDGSLPRFPIWDDIRTFDGRSWRGRCDIVTGGFPCQDISLAGRGEGIDGERSGLWSEMCRVILEVRPRFAFVENVPALTSRGLDRVLGDLAELGYDARWCVLGADDAGAPHHRKRIWILAYSSCERWGGRDHGDEAGDGRPLQTARPGAGEEQAVLADTECNGRIEGPEMFRRRESVIANGSKDVANTEKTGLSITRQKSKQQKISETIRTKYCGGNVSNTDSTRLEKQRKRKRKEQEQRTIECGGWWSTEPDIRRVVNGFPSWVDRLKALGNAQVPAVAALAFIILSRRLICQSDSQQSK